jgi:hypothetical protein
MNDEYRDEIDLRENRESEENIEIGDAAVEEVHVASEKEVEAEYAIDSVEQVNASQEDIRLENAIVDSANSEEDLQSIANEIEDLERQKQVLQDGLNDLDAWLQERENSYLSQLLRAFEDERDKVESDKLRANQMLASVVIPSALDLKLATAGFIHRLKMATLYWIAFSVGLWILKEVFIRIGQVALGDSFIARTVVTFLVEWLTSNFFYYALIFIQTSYLLTFIFFNLFLLYLF